jgi:hypothetical protein
MRIAAVNMDVVVYWWRLSEAEGQSGPPNVDAFEAMMMRENCDPGFSSPVAATQ